MIESPGCVDYKRNGTSMRSAKPCRHSVATVSNLPRFQNVSAKGNFFPLPYSTTDPSWLGPATRSMEITTKRRTSLLRGFVVSQCRHSGAFEMDSLRVVVVATCHQAISIPRCRQRDHFLLLLDRSIHQRSHHPCINAWFAGASWCIVILHPKCRLSFLSLSDL